MTFITKPTKEGETKECDSCGMDLISRWTDYKGKYEDKLQWQTLEPRKAHYDKEGNCKTETTPAQAENAASQTLPISSTDLKPLDPSTKKVVSNEADFICQIRKEVITAVKKYDVDPHPGMIWEMTALIWRKYFGEPEK